MDEEGDKEEKMKPTFYFNLVRDIPYRISLKQDEADHCCTGKHRVLYYVLKNLGFKVRIRQCEFLWSSMNLPKKVIGLSKEDLSSHTYLEIYNKNKKEWLPIDATWDSGLSKRFKISMWDGKNKTFIAVKPIRILSPKESLRRLEKEATEEFFIKDMNIQGKFYEAFNDWLEELRKAKS